MDGPARRRGRGGAARLAQIAGVLLRHGLAGLWSSLVRRTGRTPRRSSAEHLRLALEDLGTTFVKLGQILSTRGDLLPTDYQEELVRLQDAERPEPVGVVRQAIAAELGRPVEDLFIRFDDRPIAAASIGQAHSATTLDGLDVVVKVRRPGVIEAVERDLHLVMRIAGGVARWTRFGRRHDVLGVTREFADTLRAELDYVREAHNADRFATMLTDDPAIHIPRVVWPLTTSRVLTLERIRGLKITDLAGLAAQGIDRRELARRAATVVMRMVFEDGFFHADPHPGNLFVEPGGRLGIIDFGMVGVIDGATRRGLVELLAALVARNGEALVAALGSVGVVHAPERGERLRLDLVQLADRYLDQPLGDISLGTLLRDLLAIVRRHRLHLPANLALLAKTVGMCEGVGAQLDPEFRMASVLLPFVQQAVAGAPQVPASP